MKRRWFCLVALLLSSGALMAEEWKQEFSVGAHPQLRVESRDSRIVVHGGAVKTISARVVAEGRRIGPGDVAVVAQQSGDVVTIRVRMSDHHVLAFSSRGVRIEVTVPQATVLDVASSDGAIEVESVKAPARLVTADGSIRVRDFDGALRAHTSDGSIHVDGRFDELDLDTSDGSIEANIWSGSKMNSDWNIRTSDGSISLRVAPDLAASLEAWTSDGHIDLQLPVEVSRMERNRVRGRLHGGGRNLQVHTSDGSIHLNSL